MDYTHDTLVINRILAELGIIPTASTRIKLIGGKDHHALYRITHAGKSYILKWFARVQTATEIAAYRLLQQYGVPTLQVYGISEQAILLEDLATSAAWRLATADDIEHAETGSAVAAWYVALHSAGQRMVKEGIPAFLMREVDELTPASMLATGERLSLAHLPVWRVAAEHIERLTQAFRAYPETLNYNDFHWSNLALSRTEPLRAVVFDYHLLGLGPAYCDIRNVHGSLSKRARAAFGAGYGPVDERVAALDAPLSLLYSLQVALHLPQLPGWAQGCRQRVVNGEFEQLISGAVSTVTH